MKRSKRTSSSKDKPLSPLEIRSRRQLLELQRLMAGMLFRPLTKNSRMQSRWVDGSSTSSVVSQFIKPNDRLSSFERLEIYNRQYWFRILDSFYEDYPGLRAVLGEPTFLKMAEIYLSGHPSRSWSMRNLGSRLVNFLVEKPQWAKKKLALALEVARFEWAQIEAFDAASKPPLDSDTLASAAADKLKLGLQPHIRLLELIYPVDDFVLVVKREEVLRAQASNAVDSRPRRATHLKKTALPKRRLTHVAIHRYRNALYYKRLEPKAYALLKALQSGSTVAEACEKVLGSASTPADWQEKVQSWFKSWSSLGWFCAASSEDTALGRSFSKH